MRRFSLILLLALVSICGGCQTLTQSFNSAADDYKHLTTGCNSTYIAAQRANR